MRDIESVGKCVRWGITGIILSLFTWITSTSRCKIILLYVPMAFSSLCLLWCLLKTEQQKSFSEGERDTRGEKIKAAARAECKKRGCRGWGAITSDFPGIFLIVIFPFFTAGFRRRLRSLRWCCHLIASPAKFLEKLKPSK